MGAAGTSVAYKSPAQNAVGGFYGPANNAGGNRSPFFGSAIQPFMAPTGSGRNPPRTRGTLLVNHEGSGTVSGFVYDSNSNAQSGVTVLIYDDLSGQLIGSTTSAADGSWSILAQGFTKVLAVAEYGTGFNAQVFDLVVPV